MASPARHSVRTPTLEIAYEASGREAGVPVVLLHGFPDDPRAYDGSLDGLDALGCRILVPWLRGYGPTRFLHRRHRGPGSRRPSARICSPSWTPSTSTPPSWWATTGADERHASSLPCGPSAVSASSRSVATTSRTSRWPTDPQAALNEFRAWYQHYFQTDRGRAGLEQNRRDISRLLWELWSPNWAFDDATFERTAASFDNPDFVEVVIHSYRHRRSAAPGDPALASIEEDLARQPPIGVPTIVLHGEADGLGPPTEDRDAPHFTGAYQRRLIPTAGHFLPHEAPEAVVAAVASLLPGRIGSGRSWRPDTVAHDRSRQVRDRRPDSPVARRRPDDPADRRRRLGRRGRDRRRDRAAIPVHPGLREWRDRVRAADPALLQAVDARLDRLVPDKGLVDLSTLTAVEAPDDRLPKHRVEE